MKKYLFLLLALFICTFAHAYDVEIDGIYYNLIGNGKAAEVTQNPNKYTGVVDIPEKVTYDNVQYPVKGIGQSAFSECSGLTSITIPHSVTSIGNNAFRGCYRLTSITIPNSVTNIGENAFSCCSGLISITIPNSVTSIGWGAFEVCSGLTSVTISNGLTEIEDAMFRHCSGLISITFPNSVMTIGEEAFESCSGLTSITIPNSVTTIKSYAFESCSGLTSITIPNSVTTIDNYAFLNCSKLENVYCHAEKVPSTGTDAFKKSYIQYATLYVPASAINDYKTTAPWSEFGTFKIIGGSGEGDVACATPTISYENGKITFNCETEDVEYTSNITDSDISNYTTSSIDLTVTYNISVYAHKTGYKNSKTVTATLCWIDVDPKTEGITNRVAQVNAKALLIQANDGLITVNGMGEGQRVTIYQVDGKQIATSTADSNGFVSVATNLQRGTFAIVKVGNRSVKMLMQ